MTLLGFSFFLIYLFYYFILFYLFIVFGCVGSLLLPAGFSLVSASGGYSQLQCAGFSLRWLLLLRSTGSRRMGFSSCGTWAQYLWLVGSRAQAQQLWRMGLVAPWHLGSSRTRARTCVPCIGRRILNHCATREARLFVFIFCVHFNFFKKDIKQQDNSANTCPNTAVLSKSEGAQKEWLIVKKHYHKTTRNVLQ